MKNIRHFFKHLNNMFNKKNGRNESHDLSIEFNNQTNIRINVKEVMQHTYCDEFNNTVNDDMQWYIVVVGGGGGGGVVIIIVVVIVVVAVVVIVVVIIIVIVVVIVVIVVIDPSSVYAFKLIT